MIFIILLTLVIAITITFTINFLDRQKNEINFLTDRNQVLFEIATITSEDRDFYRIETHILEQQLNTINKTSKHQIREIIILKEENKDLRSRILDQDHIKMRPTYAEVKRFIENDRTDELFYVPNTFDCTEFSNTLIENAIKEGIFACFLEVNIDSNNDGKIDGGHAAVQFMTSDMGIITIEPQNDKFIEIPLEKSWWHYFDEKNDPDKHIILGYSSCFQRRHIIKNPDFSLDDLDI